MGKYPYEDAQHSIQSQIECKHGNMCMCCFSRLVLRHGFDNSQGWEFVKIDSHILFIKSVLSHAYNLLLGIKKGDDQHLRNQSVSSSIRYVM